MRLLVVEDEQDMAAYVSKGLRQHGYAVDVSHDGEDGLFMATHEQYDLIVLDLMLPKLGGLAVLKRLRQQGCAAPVILLTAKGEVEDRVEGLDAGADDYVPKPFAFSELVARIRACLRRRDGQPENTLRVGDLELDLLTRKAERADRPVELTTVEFRLLEYLMRHPGEALTRVGIIEHVWDYNFDSLSNTLDVHVCKLRRKIDEGHSTKLIHTIRGVGYVMEERDEVL